MIIGIDIGAGGALALLTPDGDLIEVADMPILRDGPKIVLPSMRRSSPICFGNGTRQNPSLNMSAPGLARAQSARSPLGARAAL